MSDPCCRAGQSITGGPTDGAYGRLYFSERMVAAFPRKCFRRSVLGASIAAPKFFQDLQDRLGLVFILGFDR